MSNRIDANRKSIGPASLAEANPDDFAKSLSASLKTTSAGKDQRPPSSSREKLRALQHDNAAMKKTITEVEKLHDGYQSSKSSLIESIGRANRVYLARMSKVADLRNIPGSTKVKLHTAEAEFKIKDNFLNEVASLTKNSNSSLKKELLQILGGRVVYASLSPPPLRRG
jgi:hypothetical protein